MRSNCDSSVELNTPTREATCCARASPNWRSLRMQVLGSSVKYFSANMPRRTSCWCIRQMRKVCCRKRAWQHQKIFSAKVVTWFFVEVYLETRQEHTGVGRSGNTRRTGRRCQGKKEVPSSWAGSKIEEPNSARHSYCLFTGATTHHACQRSRDPTAAREF